MTVSWWTRCTHCGDKVISEVIKDYVEGVDEIRKKKMTNAQREEARGKLIDSLGVPYCCRTTLIGYVPYIDPINGVI